MWAKRVWLFWIVRIWVRQGARGRQLVFVFPAVAVFLVIVGDGLESTLFFEKLPVDFYFLAKDHVHTEGHLSRVVGYVGWGSFA